MYIYSFKIIIIIIIIIIIWIGNVLLSCSHGKMSDAWGDDGFKAAHILPSLALAHRFSDTSNSPKRLYSEGINVVVSTDIRVKIVVRWLPEN
jgi:hypothetical protein